MPCSSYALLCPVKRCLNHILYLLWLQILARMRYFLLFIINYFKVNLYLFIYARRNLEIFCCLKYWTFYYLHVFYLYQRGNVQQVAKACSQGKSWCNPLAPTCHFASCTFLGFGVIKLTHFHGAAPPGVRWNLLGYSKTTTKYLTQSIVLLILINTDGKDKVANKQ